MCGRYVSPDTAAIERAWQIARSSGELFPRRFNVAPTISVPILRRAADSAGFDLAAARWAFVPAWWRKPKPPGHSFNARSEDATRNSLWRDAYFGARCLIPAEGWYEWQAAERADPQTGEIRAYRQPHYIFRADRKLVCFAGLMASLRPANQPALVTCAILTRDASPELAAIHDRMPVVLPEESFERWTDPALHNPVAIGARLACAETEFAHHPVSTQLNAAMEDDERLTAPLSPTVSDRTNGREEGPGSGASSLDPG
jgi:putative SOS response-associated peptidase YedK